MAFVSQADRGIAAVSKSLDLLGPGSYDLEARQRCSNSYAPFFSTSKRQGLSGEEGPGPGAYEHPQGGWPHTFTTYSNSNNIIIKLNTIGTHPFQSKIPRFPHTLEDAPGPADYSLQEPNKKRPPRAKSNEQCKARVRSNQLFNAAANAPSISKPSYLSARRVKTEEPAEPPKKGVLASAWGKDRSRRFQAKCVTEVGPGSYELGEQAKERKGAVGSHEFLSSTVRTFDTIVYDARNFETLALRKLEDYRGEHPAPGSYNLAQPNSGAPPDYKNQTFGSTGARFQRAKTEEAVPFYDLDRPAPSFHKKTIPFNSESKKLTSAPDLLPGPGYYAVDRRSSLPARRSIECFGSTAARWGEVGVGSEKLGPGCYEKGFERARESQEWSVFASRQSRPFQVSPAPDAKFAAYEVGVTDISRRARDQRLHRQNLQRINCAKPAFDRQSPRFPHYLDGPEERPRPKLTTQQVEHLMRRKREEERERSIEQAREQARVGRDRMDRAARFTEGRRAPGVGDYALRSHWTKKSYNIKYSQAH